jgi:hypothetical protein
MTWGCHAVGHNKISALPLDEKTIDRRNLNDHILEIIGASTSACTDETASVQI